MGLNERLYSRLPGPALGLNDRLNSALAPPDRVLYCGSGERYTIVQEANNAAVLEGASASTPWTVYVFHGADWTGYVKAVGVDVVALDAMGFSGMRDGAFEPMPFTRRPEWPECRSPYPAIIAIHAADGKATWLTSSATLVHDDPPGPAATGTSPLAYASQRGIVVSHGVIPSYIGDAPHQFFSAADLVQVAFTHGGEITLHGSDLSLPATYEAALLKYIGGRDTIEAACNTKVRGFWTDVSQNSTTHFRMRLIRELFEWSWDYSSTGQMYNVADVSSRHNVTQRLPSLGASTTNAIIDKILLAVSQPGCRNLIAMHGVGVGANDLPVAQWKYLCDQLYTTYRHKLYAVGMSSLFDLQLSPGVYDATDALCVPRWGGVQHGTMDMAALFGSDATYGITDFATGHAITLEAGDSGLWPWSGEGQVLQVVCDSGQAADAYVRVYLTKRPTYSYRVRFDARTLVGDGTISVAPITYVGTWVGYKHTCEIDTTWRSIECVFGIDPVFITTGLPYLTFIFARAGGLTYQIDNVEITRA